MKEQVEYWVKKVNEEYGFQDRNAYCIEFFTDILKSGDFIPFFFSWGYLILNVGLDMWGEKFLGVVSFSIDKKYRKNPKYFLKIQKLIDDVAREEKVNYIEQGSHYNEKLNNFLEKHGYKKSIYRRYINGKE